MRINDFQNIAAAESLGGVGMAGFYGHAFYGIVGEEDWVRCVIESLAGVEEG